MTPTTVQQLESFEELSRIIAQLSGWARELEWSTRMMWETSEGKRFPTGLRLQKEFVQIQIDPSEPDNPGLDLLEITFDRVHNLAAVLHCDQGVWWIEPDPSDVCPLRVIREPLSRESFEKLLSQVYRIPPQT